MDPLYGPRAPRWVYELLNSEDEPLGLLDGVLGGGGDVVAQSRLGGSAALSLDGRGEDIDWLSDRVRISYDPGVAGSDGWDVGTYLFTSPEEQHTEFVTGYGVSLLSKMSVIDEDTVEARYTVDAGVNLVDTVQSLILSTGESRISVTPSDAVASSGMSWDAGTAKLTVINDLLAAAGYWSLWCDGSGLFRVEPYVNPADRPVAWTFRHGEMSLHAPEWSRTRDMSSVPNRFVAVGRGDEDTEALVGVATNENPLSPFSYQSRGRWITATEENVEAESQSVLGQYAARKLLDAMDPVARLETVHAVLPLEPNHLVRFVPEDGVTRLATVQRMTYRFDLESDCAAEWREVLPV